MQPVAPPKRSRGSVGSRPNPASCGQDPRPLPQTPRRPPGSLHDGHLATNGQLSLRSVRSGRTATVIVKGELDCVSAPLLADELRTLLGEGTCRLTVGLAEMTFIDSTGLTTLVWALEAAREAGGDIVLHAPRECARKVLAITGADQFFTLT